jgi:hypothetical protein
MSTKTTFKRIALVAVAALGLGVLSVAPSSATPSGVTVTVTNGTSGLPNATADSTTAATVVIAGLLENTDSITAELVLKSFPAGASTSAGQVYMQNLDSTTPTSTTTYTVDTVTASTVAVAGGVAGGTFVVNGAVSKVQSTVARIAKGSGTAYVSHKIGVQFDSATATTRTAGTYTYTVIVKQFAAGAAVVATTHDVSLVIAAASTAAETPSAVTSFANLISAGQAAGTAKTTDDAVISVVSTAGTAAGYVFVGNRNAANGSGAALDSLTATVTGAGVVCTTTGFASPTVGTCGKSIKVAATGDYQFALQADGIAGTSSVSVVSGVLGTTYTKSVSYYTKAAKTITASALTPILAVGTNDSAVVVTAVDANGTAWTGTPYIYAATAADALIGGSATTPVACVLSTDKSKAYCPVSAIAAGTANLKVIDASTIAAATATADVSVTASIATAATVKIAFDKATYAPGEKAVVTVTPLDSTGKAIAASTGNYLAAALTSNAAFVSAGTTTTSLAAASVTTVAYAGTDKSAGSQSFVIYMPQASGTLTLSGKGGTSLPLAGQVVVTASADVVNASVDAATDAANEATDAANAATDAALAAADAADAATAAAQDASDAVAALSATVAKLVASLKAQITSLTNLVIKIQKKVKA